LRGLLRARIGSFESGEHDLNAALPLIDRMDVVSSGVFLALGADIARVRGEWSVERQFLDRARERAAASGLDNFVAFDVAEQVIGAWFSGDRATFNERAVELEQDVDRLGAQGLSYLARVARGRNVVPQSADLPKYVIFGRLIALSRSRDESERVALARDALNRARVLQFPFVEALAAVAVALCDPAAFDEASAIARNAASRCDAPAFVHAVNAFVQGHDNLGMLMPFVTQITRDRSDAAPIALDVLAGRVRVDGAVVRISGRELELLAALAQRREPTTRSRIAAMLWPDLDEFASRNSLSVCLHRLRTHVKREDAIERDSDGYRLHADAFVDLWELDRAAVVLRSRERLRESDRELLARGLRRLQEERSASIESWEWFAPALRRIDDLRTELAHRLASDALDRGDPDLALSYAQDIIEVDPCDEPARELAIRAHLAIGDRAAALRQYRQYRDVLKAEFASEPSASLTKLVMGA
jgi:DNA-binding SARP family transcriptional activator